MSRWSRALALCVSLASINACTPPAAAVDEERLARRIAELLADQGELRALCSRSDEPADAEPTESAEGQPAEAPLDRAQLMAALAANAPVGSLGEPPLSMPAVVLPPELVPQSTGTGDHRRVCIDPSLGVSTGDPAALLAVVVVFDAECPYCRRFLQLIPALRTRYGDALRLQFVQMPMSFHQRAVRAGEALIEANRQRPAGGFDAVLQRLLEATPRDLATDDFVEHFDALGLDSAALRAALEARTHAATLAREAAVGTQSAITGTPTSFINGLVVSGAVSIERMTTVLDTELARARRLQRAGPSRTLAHRLCTADASPNALTH
ncbi:MAG: thioredoxin domain-containing protein [Deltaproteobacteria bacterium]|nr:thioredoxin domain-containing protein [Deltaproteobacteria bacterium]